MVDVISLLTARSATPSQASLHHTTASPQKPATVTTAGAALLFEAPEDPTEFVAWDSETFLIEPGNLTPQLVCVQFQHCSKLNGFWVRQDPVVMGGLQSDIDAGAAFIRSLIEETDLVLVTHNGFYDYAVLLKHYNWSKSLFRSIDKAFKEGRLRDTLIRAKLHAIEMGWLEYDPEMGTPAKFSLGDLALKYTQQHIEGKHGPDVWRLRYSELHGIPLDRWPRDAYNYAALDPVYTADVYLALLKTSYASPDEVFQLRKAWALYLGSVQGLATDPEKVDELEKLIIPKIEDGIRKLTEIGIYRPSTVSVDKNKVAELVESLLGDKTPRTAAGRAKLDAKTIAAARRKAVGKELGVLDHFNQDIGWFVDNAPEYVLEKPGSKNMAALYEVVSTHFEGNPPTTATGRVSTSRSVLAEISVLQPLVDIGEAQKVKSTYLPVFKNPIVNARVNSLVATGRPSYSSPNIANQPRMKGVRECWVAPMDLITLTEDE